MPLPKWKKYETSSIVKFRTTTVLIILLHITVFQDTVEYKGEAIDLPVSEWYDCRLDTVKYKEIFVLQFNAFVDVLLQLPTQFVPRILI